MRKILEINLLNTHYYLRPGETLDFHHPPYATIHPSFLAHFLTQNPTIICYTVPTYASSSRRTMRTQ